MGDGLVYLGWGAGLGELGVGSWAWGVGLGSLAEEAARELGQGSWARGARLRSWAG